MDLRIGTNVRKEKSRNEGTGKSKEDPRTQSFTECALRDKVRDEGPVVGSSSSLRFHTEGKSEMETTSDYVFKSEEVIRTRTGPSNVTKTEGGPVRSRILYRDKKYKSRRKTSNRDRGTRVVKPT